MEDETMHFPKPGAQPSGSSDAPHQPSQSRIFNTSVRGWIALILAVVLGIALMLVVIAPFVGVTMPETTATTITTLFASGFTAAVTYYFQQAQKEGLGKTVATALTK